MGLTCAELDRQARAIAAQMQGAGLPPLGQGPFPAKGRVALLLYPPGLDFITAFLGCLYAGCVAVPTFPTSLRRSRSALHAIVEDADPGVVLTVTKIQSQAAAVALPPALQEARWIATDKLDLAAAKAWKKPKVESKDLALLQYTSGSTSLPKGVMVSHANLLHNQRMIRDAFAQTAASIIVSWLPLYHDMGLIGGVLQPLYLGARCVLMAPMTFLQNPFRWLEAISSYRATTSGGPNFAYELCMQKISEEQKTELDLSSWTVAFNGAEPIRSSTLERFADTYYPSGFAKRSFCPCYGLAEATLFVSAQPASETGHTRDISERELRQGRVVPGNGARLVSCGRPWLDQRIRIVDPETRRPAGPGKIGEVWVAGASIAQGYWQQLEETAATFEVFLADSGEGPFLRTGDLGFLDGEHLFVTGRLKDLIIVRGLNYYPHDIEATVEASHPDLRPGCGAAFSVEVATEERLVLVQELRRKHQKDTEATLEAVRQALSEEHQLKAHAVVLIRTGSIPKTTSGKIRRRACREAYLAGELHVVAESVTEEWAEGEGSTAGGTAEGSAPSLLRSALRLLPPDQGEALIVKHLAGEIAGQLGKTPTTITADCPLSTLGLDSLAAVELQGRIVQALGVAPTPVFLLEGPTLQEVAREVLAKLSQADERHGLVASAETTEFPLTEGQRALWFVQQLDPKSSAYNIVAAVRIRSVIDGGALRRTAEALAARHPVLTIRIMQDPTGDLRQVIDPELGIDLELEDLGAATAAELDERVTREIDRPFDLERGPLMRMRLLTHAADDHVMVWSLHHIAADFWSLAILARDFGELYRAESSSRPSKLPALPIRFADWVRHAAKEIGGARGEHLWDYWREALHGPLPVLELPTDLPRPPLQTYRGAACSLQFDRDLRETLHALGQAHGATLFMTLLAVFESLLHRYTGQRDLVVGSPMAGRTATEATDVVGYFAQPVALRADFSGRPSFAELLRQVRQAALGAFDHQDFPFPLLVERLLDRRDPSRSPIFQVMFVLQKGHPSTGKELAAFALGETGGRVEIGGLTLESMRLEKRAAQFDLELMVAETPDGLAASLIYNSDLFDRSTAERILGHFGVMLRGAATDPSSPVARLPLLTAAEERQLRIDWQDTAAPTEQRSYQEIFEEQASLRATATAAVCGGAAVSYGELNALANRLAHALRSRGIGPGARVAVLMERGIDLLATILGIFKAGAIYQPLDPRHPEARLAEAVAQSEPTALLVSAAFEPALERSRPATVPTPLFELAGLLATEAEISNPPVGARPEHVAYVIYTSGSTGRPKGVVVEHRGMINHLCAKVADLAMTSTDRVVQNASQCFDISIWQFLLAPFLGGEVHIFPDEIALDPASLLDSTAGAEASLLEVVPSMLTAMLDEVEARGAARPAFPSLRWLIPTGEALPPELCRRWLTAYPRIPLLNAYGPTECSDDVTHARIVEPPLPSSQQTPIGRPILGMRMLVLDRALENVPIGVPGELYVAGIGVGRGYLDDPCNTARAFVSELGATAPGARMYKTGDLVRYRADGALEFLGRLDHQVKIRGHRIELGEIEARLLEYPAIREAVVQAREDQPGQKRLVAYAVPFAGQQLTVDEIRGYLGGQLADYMVPAAILLLEAMPLTPNGKVDRKALPAPTWARSDLSTEFVAPRHPTEERLAEIWSELLGVAAVGTRDNFFELGGHSLLAAQIHMRMRELFRVELPLSAFLRMPTVAEQAALIEQALRHGTAENSDLDRLPRPGELPLSFSQERFWFLNQLEPASAAYNIPAAVRLQGALDIAVLRRVLDEVVRRHESLRATFPTIDGAPRQIVASASPVSFRHVDLRGVPAPEREAVALREAGREAGRIFDLACGPLFRSVLLVLEPTDHILVLNMHHIISDGWSLRILLDEITALYRAFAAGLESPLPELPWQFADLAQWQRQRFTGELLARELDFWREMLAGRTAALDLPTDRPRPAVQGFHGRSESLALPEALAREIEHLGTERGATLYMTLLAAYQILLWHYTGREANVGFPIAGRERLEAEGVIGLFVNTLVVPSDLSGDPTFVEVLEALRDRLFTIYDHQGMPFEKLVEELEPERDLAHSPLFQVLFAFQEDPAGGIELPELRLTPLVLDSGAVKFPITLFLERVEEGLEGGVRYDTELFDRTTIQRLVGHLAHLLEELAAAPQKRLSELDYLTPAEHHQLTIEWQGTPGVASSPQLVPDLFEQQVATGGDTPAVRFEDEVLNYRELNRRANRLAHVLLELGVGSVAPVGILLDRSLEMVVAILGVLKAGAAYLPLEPSTPQSRIEHVLADARAEIVLTREALAGSLPTGVHAVAVDAEVALRHAPLDGEENPRRRLDGRHPCYLIYTSGSTGTPKGVVIEHRQLASYVAGLAGRLGVAGESFATVSSVAADLGNTAIYSALTTGGTLHVIAEQRIADPAALSEYFLHHPVDGLKIVPSHLAALLASEQPAAVLPRRTLVVGGEALSWELADELRRLAPELRIFNHYGPTEATIGVAAHPLADDRLRASTGTVPIGRPLRGNRLQVLDTAGRPVALGVAGEAHLGGGNLTRGYLDLAATTGASFVPDAGSSQPGERLYKSGDRMRRRFDGKVEFLGRRDSQLKIRGFRIELGEVEAVLAQHSEVKQAIVVPQTVPSSSGTVATETALRLVAYAIPAASTHLSDLSWPAALSRFLRERLPGHAVPAAFVALEALPLTPNGKIDRQALPAPDTAAAPVLPAAAARNETEELLVRVWAEFLGREVDIHDDFFALGGHSLLATRVVSRIRSAFGVELPVRSLFEAPTPARLAAVIARTQRGTRPGAPPIAALAERREVVLSFAQERLWFLQQFLERNPAYSIPLTLTFRGPLRRSALGTAFDALVERHEVLRTRYEAREASAVQVIEPPGKAPLPLVDLSGLPAGARETAARRSVAAEARRAFDLTAGVPLRKFLLRFDKQHHVLFLNYHHILSDGWSRGILHHELSALYLAAVQERPSRLPALPVQYADFAVWQRQRVEGEALAAELDYWRGRLGQGEGALDLPTDRPRQGPGLFGRRVNIELTPAFSDGVETASLHLGVTPFMLFLAAWNVFLMRYSGQRRIHVGTPVAGRTRSEIEGLIGCFINTLVIRTDLDPRMTGRKLLEQIRQNTLDAQAHQDAPFEKLVTEIDPLRSVNSTPLFQVIFALQNTPFEEIAIPRIETSWESVGNGTTKFDLTLVLGRLDGRYQGVLEYRSDIYDTTTIARWLNQFRTLLEGLIDQPEEWLGRLSLATGAECHQMLFEWNDTVADLPREWSIPTLFDAQAEATPNATALVYRGRRMPYRRLRRRSNQLARHLRSRGVGPESRVGLCVERSFDLVVAILAILKAEAAFVPLDPKYPDDRLELMLEDSGIEVILLEQAFLARFTRPGIRLVYLEAERSAFKRHSDADLPRAPYPETLAYVMYTSGSSGRPKGVAVSHRSVVRLVRETSFVDFGPEEVFLQFAPISFDASTLELWGPLLNGGRLVLPSNQVADLEALALLLEKQGVTTLWLTSGLFHQMAKNHPEALARVRQLLAGGDVLSTQRVEQTLARLVDKPSFRLINGYGPTENTTFSCCQPLEATTTVGASVPIGRPIAHSSAYILGPDLEPATLGMPGELLVGGDGLARGYLDRPALTAELFIPDPVGGKLSARLYRTGDRARFLGDGRIEFLGRIDFQVKIRGFRVEPGEIEAVLCADERVSESLVVATDDPAGGLRLVAYVLTAGDLALPQEDLRAVLRNRLPEYMMPTAIIALDAWPLNPNGKIDRQRLPQPGAEEVDSGSRYAAPRTLLEEELTAMWSKLLGVERVGVEDNFFELGGHSLAATQLVSWMRQKYGFAPPLQLLYEEPTVAALSRALATADGQPTMAGDEAEPILRRRRRKTRKSLPGEGG